MNFTFFKVCIPCEFYLQFVCLFVCLQLQHLSRINSIFVYYKFILFCEGAPSESNVFNINEISLNVSIIISKASNIATLMCRVRSCVQGTIGMYLRFTIWNSECLIANSRMRLNVDWRRIQYKQDGLHNQPQRPFICDKTGPLILTVTYMPCRFFEHHDFRTCFILQWRIYLQNKAIPRVSRESIND